MLIQPVLLPIAVNDALIPRQKVERQRGAARQALSICAQRCRVPDGSWPQQDGGAPLPRDGYHWSISHKPLMVAAVIARQPVGIDIEHIQPRSHIGLWDRLADAREWDIAGERSWTMFFRLWTAKEATLKANSKGIGDLERCRVAAVPDEHSVELDYHGRRWHVAQIFHHQHVAALAPGNRQVHWHLESHAAE